MLQIESDSLSDSFEVVDKLSVVIQRLTHRKNICIKVENLLKKNVGLNMLKKIKTIFNGELVDMKDLPKDLVLTIWNFLNIPLISSLYVEKSFSA